MLGGFNPRGISSIANVLAAEVDVASVSLKIGCVANSMITEIALPNRETEIQLYPDSARRSFLDNLHGAFKGYLLTGRY
jgi:hypothetical protein